MYPRTPTDLSLYWSPYLFTCVPTPTASFWRQESDQLHSVSPILSTIPETECCCCWITSVVSDSVQPHRWQPTRLPRPWDSPGKNTGVGCHFLLQCMKVKSESEVAQLCLTLKDPMDCSLPGSSIHGIFQARVLKWSAISFSNAWKWKLKVKLLSHVRLLKTPWTAAYQAPPSMGFSRQEYWSGVPLPSPILIYAWYLYHRWIRAISLALNS